METKRVCSPGAEQWLGIVQPVLDKGEIELVDYCGTEKFMVGVARISHGKILPHTDEVAAQRLINYFTRERHTSPFEFIETTWRWKLPIFVARQVIRHRTANVNEQSARHSELGADLYIPELDRVQGQSKDNKQGSASSKDKVREAGSEGTLPIDIRQDFIDALKQIEETGKFTYKSFLDDGIAKELARVHLPVGVYTNWVWKMDLHNLFHFLGLRLDSHAQYEIRVYAEAMYKVLKDAYPMCCQAFEEYKLNAVTFSASEMGYIKGALSLAYDLCGEKVDDRIKAVLVKAGLPGVISVSEGSTNPTSNN